MVPARTSVARLLALVLVAALSGAAVTWAVARSDGPRGGGTAASPQPVRSERPVVRTRLPGLVAPTGEPVLPSVVRAHPRPGSVVTARGPFDDRFSISRLRLGPTAVTGVVTVTSDVSDLLELQVLAGFYDRRGRLLGTSRHVRHGVRHHDGSAGAPSEVERFSVTVPRRLRDRVASAAVGVPVLVNE